MAEDDRKGPGVRTLGRRAHKIQARAEQPCREWSTSADSVQPACPPIRKVSAAVRWACKEPNFARHFTGLRARLDGDPLRQQPTHN